MLERYIEYTLFCTMHKSTKIPPALRKEIFKKWKKDGVSQRQLAKEYHVDKRVIGRIIERGKDGDFEIRTSVNHRYLKKTSSQKKSLTRKKTPSRSTQTSLRKHTTRSNSKTKRAAKN